MPAVGKILTWDQILSQPIPKITWDVEGLVARGRRVVLFGETGAGKTWVAQHMALTVAAGLPKWLGRFPVPQARKVLYVDEENPLEDVQRRLGRLGRALGLGKGVPLVVSNRGGLLFTEDGAKELLAWMRLNWNAEFLVIDSLRRTLQGSENLQQDISAYWRNVDILSREGITTETLHHMNKPPLEGTRELRYRASGSTDILAGADLGLALVRTADDDVCEIVGAKGRTAKSPRSFHVRRWDEDPKDENSPVHLEIGSAPRKEPPPTLTVGPGGDIWGAQYGKQNCE